MPADSSATESLPRRPSRSLQGQVAIITGAGSLDDGIGNGRAAALLLAEAGCNVVCVDLDLPLAERTVAMIDADRQNSSSPDPIGHALALSADVTSAADCSRIVDITLSHFSRLDILVNNVGIGGAPGTALDVDMVAWTRSMEINVSSMVLMAKYAIPAMLNNTSAKAERGYTGAIVNMGSVAGLRGGTPTLLYPTAKGAVVNMTRAMAVHHAPQGIRVNCVCPGMLYTPMMYGGGKMSEEARAARRSRSLLKTEGNGWDAGCAVRFLVGEESRWVTGTVLVVDAGSTASVGSEIPGLYQKKAEDEEEEQ